MRRSQLLWSSTDRQAAHQPIVMREVYSPTYSADECAADPEAVLLSMPDVPRHTIPAQPLSKLISLAAATLDSDTAAAKACLERAAELLSVTIEGRLSPADTASRGGLAPWQQRNVTAYVAANIASTIRVCDLARVAGLSHRHFFRAFRQSFAETPLSHVAKQRIQHAQSLMLSSAAPLSQIALDCGMCDQAHFTRVFRRIVGVNPSAWRLGFRTADAKADLGAEQSPAS